MKTFAYRGLRRLAASPLGILLLTGLIVGALTVGGRPAHSQNGGMPDLIVLARDLAQARTDVITVPPGSCSIAEGHVPGPGTWRLLRFTTTYPNIGTADLVVGNPASRPDLFEFDTCHGHAHFREYADYRLWTPAGFSAWRALRDNPANANTLSEALLSANPTVAAQMVSGDKRGFCIIDVVRHQIPGMKPQPRTYTSCATNQGISVGWADQYNWRLDGQWINITGLGAGDYMLEVEVNAEHLLPESNYANNSAWAGVRIR